MTISYRNIHLVFAAGALATVVATLVATGAFTAAGAMAPAQNAALGAGDSERGAQIYKTRCTGCHSLDANRIGPRHRGVYGRVAGSLDDFRYSPALQAATVVWDDNSLNRWLTNPEAFIPGQRMGFRLGDDAARRDVIAFLKRESGA